MNSMPLLNFVSPRLCALRSYMHAFAFRAFLFSLPPSPTLPTFVVTSYCFSQFRLTPYAFEFAPLGFAPFECARDRSSASRSHSSACADSRLSSRPLTVGTRHCTCLIWGFVPLHLHARIAQSARMQANEGVCVGETPSHIYTGQVASTAVDA